MANRFIVDHMLVKLGKYLRIAGYDAEWDAAVRTHELITRSNAEGRVFLTRNSRIPDQYPQPNRMVQVKSRDPAEQFHEITTALHLRVGDAVFSKCIRCNRTLEQVCSDDLDEQVHPNVRRRYKSFYRCPDCGTIFWKGSHVRNTCRKLGLSDRSELPGETPDD